MTADTIITGIALKKTYGGHAVAILSGRLEALPRERKKGAKQKYKVVSNLPSLEEFQALRAKRFTTTVDALVADAFSEFESLKDELQEWYDGMPENLQGAQKGDDLQSAIDALANLEAPDVPNCATNLQTVYIPVEKVESRPDRRDDAVARIDTAIDVLNDAMDDDDSDVKYTDEQKEEMQQLIDDLENAKNDAEGVDFPTMFG
jgi:cell fate (sporulation/competence/biofilm development) regulator YlbF (YheA/YmcA/DUF963 family)